MCESAVCVCVFLIYFFLLSNADKRVFQPNFRLKIDILEPDIFQDSVMLCDKNIKSYNDLLKHEILIVKFVIFLSCTLLKSVNLTLVSKKILNF